ncbi:MAG: hypothetical protein H6825_00145 [Planctomycetes bacterium]|nr:hypothetical protein [Planctomycetota bacterium]
MVTPRDAVEADLVPTHVQLLPSACEAPVEVRFRLPEFMLFPGDHRLSVSGFTEGVQSTRVRRNVTISDGVPLALAWDDPLTALVAVHRDDGATVVERWAWRPGEAKLERLADAFVGDGGVVVDLTRDPRDGRLLLLDARAGRVLEVGAHGAVRVLVDASTIPSLVGRRSLSVLEQDAPEGAAVIVVTSQPPDSDAVSLDGGVLEIHDLAAGDGRIDSWTLVVP